MAQMSDYLEGQLRAHIFRTASFTKPTVIAIALCTAASTDASTGATIVEVANANAYARVSLNPSNSNWTADSATDGLTDNAVAIIFPTCTTADWGEITHIAICDSATWGAGNLLLHGTLATPKIVGVGDTFKFSVGDLNVIFQ